MASGAGAGLLAGLIGIGGGIVIVPVVFYGLVEAGLLRPGRPCRGWHLAGGYPTGCDCLFMGALALPEY